MSPLFLHPPSKIHQFYRSENYQNEPKNTEFKRTVMNVIKESKDFKGNMSKQLG